MFYERFSFWLLNVALVGYVIGYPDKYEFQDTDTNKKINLLDLLKEYEDDDKEQRRDSTKEPTDDWTGPWMPHRPGEPTRPPKVFPTQKMNETSSIKIFHNDQIPMGVKIPSCDDGKTNLTVDWDYSKSSVTCYGRKIKPNYRLPSTELCKIIPKNYVAIHKCMYDVIEYDEDIPLYGTHRLIWPVYGEYMYIPKQRWLHTLEHGAIVMLYHPCAHKKEVNALKHLVKNCLRRHIITPYNLLDEDRPLALLSWGCILRMSHVNKDAVVNFIRDHALKAPERLVYKDGDFNDQLKENAETVSDEEDTKLCPKLM